MSAPRPVQPGWVYLVGAGPGDAQLLTLRADDIIRQADVVVYDNLVGKDVMARVPTRCARIYVGKKASNHSMRQEDICALLVKLAREGRRVLRLKGGDPYVFGRGGEEAETLVAAGVPFEVVPGVTAASGIGAYAGIPLTHRDHAQSVVFVTGHRKEGPVQLDWAGLARPRQTVIVYMGVSRVGEIAEQLVAHGLPASTPAALVRHGTLPDQTAVIATLADLAQKVEAAGMKPPALMIIGTVVSLGPTLGWFRPD